MQNIDLKLHKNVDKWLKIDRNNEKKLLKVNENWVKVCKTCMKSAEKNIIFRPIFSWFLVNILHFFHFHQILTKFFIICYDLCSRFKSAFFYFLSYFRLIFCIFYQIFVQFSMIFNGFFHIVSWLLTIFV